MAKKNFPAAVEAPASRGQLQASDLLPEAHIARLKTLNGVLVKNTVENREQIHQLRSELSSLAADNDILDATACDIFRVVLSSSLSDAVARSTVEMDAAAETVEKMLKKAESVTAELNSVRMRLLDVTREKDRIERDMERVVKERDLSRIDLEEKRKELVNLEKTFQSSQRAHAQLLKQKKITDAKFSKLEEELQSARHDKDLLKRCRDEDKNLAEKLVREMEAMISQKDEDMGSLKGENKENAAKISAFEEECRFLKAIRGQLDNEVCGKEASLKKLKEEREELFASYEEIKTSYLKIEEDHKKKLTEFGRLEKEKLDSEKTFEVKQKEMTMQINELKGNITKMAAEKILVDQRSANYQIQIGKLQAEISELQFARKSLEDIHRSCNEKIARKDAYFAAVQKERNLKGEEAVALTMQIEPCIEQIQKQLNHLTTENEETKKHITSLMEEKALLEKLLECSKQEFQGVEKKLKTLKDASGQVFALLKTTTDEVMDEERTQENCASREIEVEIENDEEMKLFVKNLEAMKLAMKGKDTKIKDLNNELELLELSVAYAKNKGSIWKWLFPATTTIFAAVSLAYAARAR